MRFKKLQMKIMSVGLSVAMALSTMPVYASEQENIEVVEQESPVTEEQEESAVDEQNKEDSVPEADVEEVADDTEFVCDEEADSDTEFDTNNDTVIDTETEESVSETKEIVTTESTSEEFTSKEPSTTVTEETATNEEETTTTEEETTVETEEETTETEEMTTTKEEHEHILIYQYHSEGMHTITCENEDCNYMEAESCDYNEENICILCGEEKEIKETVHKHKYLYQQNGDGTHTVSCEDETCTFEENADCELNEENICELCGYEKHVHDFLFTSFNNGTHKRVCLNENCNEKEDVFDCNYENNVCKECGYEAIEMYKLTFVDRNEAEVYTLEVEENTLVSELELPEAPLEEGYTFLEWNFAETAKITEDMTITPIYDINTYTVRFMDNETVVGERKVSFQETISDLPQMKNSNKRFFIKWEMDGEEITENTVVTKDMTVEAKWKELVDEKHLNKTVDGVYVSVCGNLPEDATLEVKNVNNNDYLNLYNDIEPDNNSELAKYFEWEPFVTAALDISIMVDGEHYQPKDFGETVIVTLSNLEKVDAETEVKHIDDQTGEVETVAKAEENAERITFETDSFSVYTVGGADYDTSAAVEYGGIDSGYGHAYWFEDSKTLLIMDMIEGSYYSSYAWHPLRSEVNKVVLADNITFIGKAAFDGYKALESIDLSNVITIKHTAFYGCSALKSVGNTSKLTSVMNNAFYNCKALENIDLSNVTDISYSTFDGCSTLKSVGNTNNITTINDRAFSGCSLLESINLSNVTTIGGSAFSGCSALKSVGNTSKLISLGNYAFDGCSTLESIDLSNVITIESYAFRGCNLLETIDLSNVATIKRQAFLGCNALKFVGDTSKLISISEDAFNDCSSLTEVDLSNCTSIGTSAFRIYPKAQFKITAASDTAKAYNWSSDNRVVEWSDLIDINVSYTGGAVTEGLTPADSDIVVTANYHTVGIGSETIDENETLKYADNLSITVSAFELGKANTATVIYWENDVLGQKITKTKTLEIPVKEKAIASKTLTEIEAVSSITELLENKSITKDDIAVTGKYHVVYDNGTEENITETVNSDDITISGAVKADVGTNEVIVSYNGKQTSIYVTGIAKSEASRTLTSIEVTYDNSEVYVGQEPKNFVVAATYHVIYDNGDEADISVIIDNSRVTLSDDKTASEGTNTVSVTFTDNGISKTDDFSYTGIKATVVKETLIEIEAVYDDSTTTYEADKIDTSRITVTGKYQVEYSDGTYKDTSKVISVTDCEVTGNTEAVEGENHIQVSYQGKSFEITFNAVKLEEVSKELIDLSAKYEGGNVTEGNTISKADIKVTGTFKITYNSGKTAETEEIITNVDEILITANPAVIGENKATVKVSHDTITKEFECTYIGIKKQTTSKPNNENHSQSNDTKTESSSSPSVQVQQPVPKPEPKPVFVTEIPIILPPVEITPAIDVSLIETKQPIINTVQEEPEVIIESITENDTKEEEIVIEEESVTEENTEEIIIETEESDKTEEETEEEFVVLAIVEDYLLWIILLLILICAGVKIYTVKKED